MSFLDGYARRLGVLEYLGTWSASGNSPALASGVGQKGGYYVVSSTGATNLDGVTDWVVGDWAIFNGTVWQKIDNTDAGGGGAASIDDAIQEGVTTRAPSQDAVHNALIVVADRAAHTGWQPSSTISDFETASQSVVITSAITNGDTTHAPSADAVFDALSAKMGTENSATAGPITINATTSSNLALNFRYASNTIASLTSGTVGQVSLSADYSLSLSSGGNVYVSADGAEVARFDAGEFRVGTTVSAGTMTGANSSSSAGAVLSAGGVDAAAYSGGVCNFNRMGTDGTIVYLKGQGVTEGSISVSGTTVSYNSFAGSHWSQLLDGSRPEILRGTVMESIDAMCEWPGEEPTERLPRSKVSDTPASSAVYGVFMSWDDDWESTNDLYVTALGSFVCRIAQGQTPAKGDLLESNGDGCARVQADDVIRSSTLGKVTTSTVITTYPDGSFLVPVVLCCG